MYRQSEKIVKQQYLLHMSPQYGELGLLAAEIDWRVWGTSTNFNGFRVLAALLHGTLVVGVSQTLRRRAEGVVYSTGRPSRWALAHIVFYIFLSRVSHCFFYCYLNVFKHLFNIGQGLCSLYQM